MSRCSAICSRRSGSSPRFWKNLRANPRVREIRQCGFITGIELDASDPSRRTGARICLAARNHGLLTRPILDTIVLMLPLCVTATQIETACDAIEMAIADAMPA